MNTNALSWEQVCAMRWLRDIPGKVETNRHGKIMMSPASSWHGGYQGEIGYWLRQSLPEGKVIMECPIETSDGTRVADVAWISRARWFPHRRAVSLPIAPEICVEILSPSNTREELLGKRGLYFAAGAQEVWLCHEDGRMEFMANNRDESLPSSLLCPAFPRRIEWQEDEV